MLVELQTSLDVAGKVVLAAENDAERSSVFDCLAGALGLVGHHGMGSIAEDAGLLLVPVRVRLVDVETPGLAFHRVLDKLDTQGVQFAVVASKDLFGSDLFKDKAFGSVLGELGGHEAVERDDVAGGAWAHDDLVVLVEILVRIAAPELDGRIGSPGKAKTLDLLLGNVASVTSLRRRLDLWRDTNRCTGLGSNTIRTDDKVGSDAVAVTESDDVGLGVDVVCNVVHDNLDGDPLARCRDGGVEEHAVHVLTVEHVVDVPPRLLVVVEVVLVEDLAGLPITHGELHQDDRSTRLNIDLPLVKPLCAVGGARDRSTHLDVKASSFVYRTPVARTTKGDGACKATDPTTEDGDVELLERGTSFAHFHFCLLRR